MPGFETARKGFMAVEFFKEGLAFMQIRGVHKKSLLATVDS